MKFREGEVNIICTNIDRSLAFYREVLGFRIMEEERGAVRLALGRMVLLLLPVAGHPAPDAPYCSRAEISFDLETDDLDTAAQHFLTHHVEFAKPWEPGADSFVVADPDGLRIEVVCGRQTARAHGEDALAQP